MAGSVAGAGEHTGRIVAAGVYPGEHPWLRLESGLAAATRPGHYLHLAGRPWAVLRAGAGWLDCLQRGFEAPAAGSEVSVVGPLGTAFDPDLATPRVLLLGAEGGIAPLIFLADGLRQRRPRLKPLVLLSSERPFPFRPQPSRIMLPGLPGGVIGAVPLLEDWGVPSRLASPLDLPGCFAGGLDALARSWLEISQGVADVSIYACGPEALLDSARRLARDYRLPCQTVAAVF